MVVLLVLVNVVIYFGVQSDDRRAEAAAYDWYYEAGLAEIELPRYRDWLLEQGERDFVETHEHRLEERGSPWLGRRLADGEFEQALLAGGVIEDDTVQARWRRQHAEFEARLERSTTMAWGLTPVRAEWATWLTHMYLHGGLLHLIGNMIFLAAVGFLVELALGSWLLLGLYTLAGFGGAALFIVANPAQAMPLVGASGAIAGLMGMLAVVYGMQRIRFFYFVGVYFDYVKAPALVLLPLWLGYELYQYIAADERDPVAYSAHIGGLVVGALAATGVRVFTPLVDHDAIGEREREEHLQTDLDEVNEAVRTLDAPTAQRALRRLQQAFPEDPRVWQAAYDVGALQPASEAFHAAAVRILQQPGTDSETAQWVVRIYNDYRERARPRPRLNAATIENVVPILLARGEARAAMPLVNAMLKRPDAFTRPGEMACRLARALSRGGDRERALVYYQHVLKAWPGSDVARVAAQGLGRQRE